MVTETNAEGRMMKFKTGDKVRVTIPAGTARLPAGSEGEVVKVVKTHRYPVYVNFKDGLAVEWPMKENELKRC